MLVYQIRFQRTLIIFTQYLFYEMPFAFKGSKYKVRFKKIEFIQIF